MWATSAAGPSNSELVYSQSQVLQLDDQGQPVINQDGSNATVFDAGVVTLRGQRPA